VRVSAYLDSGCVSLEETMKLHGMLQHTKFILTAGSSYFLAISCAIMGFKGDRHCHHHVACNVHMDLLWWKAILVEGCIAFHYSLTFTVTQTCGSMPPCPGA